MTTTDPFTTAANAAAVDYARTPRMNVGTVRDRIGEAHADGWEAARSYLAAQEPTEGETDAVQEVLHDLGVNFARARALRVLSAARRARGGTT